MRFSVLLLALVVAAPALAQAPARTTDARRTEAAPAAAPAPVRPTRRPNEDPTLTPSALRRQSVVATPRLGRALEDEAAACRLACAPAYYDCLTEIDRRQCTPRRLSCLTQCSKGSRVG